MPELIHTIFKTDLLAYLQAIADIIDTGKGMKLEQVEQRPTHNIVKLHLRYDSLIDVLLLGIKVGRLLEKGEQDA